jgi:hypothetical protein
VLLTITLLWLTGRDPLGGPYDAQVLGSIGDWGAGIVTGTAVWLAARQFATSQREVRRAEHRVEALKVTAWASWTAHDGGAVEKSSARIWRRPKAPADPRQISVLNRANSTIFDWILTVMPSHGWDTFLCASAQLGPLHPDADRKIPLEVIPAEVRWRRFGPRPDRPGPPRYVVLTFNDAWGNGWVRTNGDLQQLPEESRFLPMLVHLRNPAMAWAGVIDDADWTGFWQAAGVPADLPDSVESMLPDPDQPWLEHDRVTSLNQVIQQQRLRRRGSCTYVYERRGVNRRIRRAAAFAKVQRFFSHLAAHDYAVPLFLRRG